MTANEFMSVQTRVVEVRSTDHIVVGSYPILLCFADVFIFLFANTIPYWRCHSQKLLRELNLVEY